MLGHKLLQIFANDFQTAATVRSNSAASEISDIISEKQVYTNVDAEDFQTVDGVIEKTQPDVIVNCIGIIKQLASSASVVKTLRVNSIFPHLLSESARKHNARLITVGTDCVFKGTRGGYVEADVPDAEDLYGKSKNLGELAAENCLTIRTSIIGRELSTAHSLAEWFLSKRGKEVEGFSRAVFSGFPTIVLADIIKNLIENHPRLSGLYHVSSEPINKYDLLCLLRDAYKADVRIKRKEEFEIDRSLDSSRFRAATGYSPPMWAEMVEKMAADPLPYEAIRKHSAAKVKGQNFSR